MKILYLGTPDFAVKPLQKLVDFANTNKNIEIVGVVTNVDKPFGRKRILTACPVKQFALGKNLPVFSYEKISRDGVEDLKKLAPDLMITCAYGHILSQEIINVAKNGVFNIHASLLPKYRGASPIHSAILNGEDKTGVTIMKTELGVDSGDIILQEEVLIEKDDNCGTLFNKLSVVGANLIIKALEQLLDGEISFTKQDENLATLTKIIKKEDALIDFNKTSFEVNNKIRAFNPSPIAFFTINDEPFKVYEAREGNGIGKVGEVIECEKSLEIACAKGSIIVKKIQKSGGKAMDISDFLRGYKIEKGVIVNK